MGVGYNPKIVTNGLVFHLDAKNIKSYPGSGTTWSDITGNNNGVLVNSPTLNSEGYFTFNGTNQEVTTTITHTGINSTSFTFFGWFRTNSSSGRKIIGFQSNQTGTAISSYDKNAYVGTNGKLYFGIWNGSVRTVNSTTTVSDNKWHSFAAYYNDSGNIRIFVDGNLEGSLAATSTDNEAYIRIGGYALSGWTNASNGYFPGDIAVLSRYNRILTTSEILTNHNALRGRFGV